jgi:hypothetical protein
VPEQQQDASLGSRLGGIEIRHRGPELGTPQPFDERSQRRDVLIAEERNFAIHLRRVAVSSRCIRSRFASQ